MGFEREKRLAGDPRDLGVDDDLVPQQLEDQQAAWPGKRTQVEPRLAEDLAESALSRFAVGRRTLLAIVASPPVLASPVSRMAPTASPSSVLRSAFDDLRLRGLREVVAALASMGGGRGLIEATLSTASKALRPALPSLTSRPTPPDPAGQAMWRTAERRATTLYRRAVDHGELQLEDPAVAQALARAGGGQPLSAAVRRDLELKLGVALDRVRIHTDSVAADATRAVRAEAFTVGEDIFFADGAYAPETPSGRRLLAHELTHVLQGHQGRLQTDSAGIRVSSPDESLEREAEVVADRIAARQGEQSVDRAPSPPRGGRSSSATARSVRSGVDAVTENAIAAISPRLGLDAAAVDVRSNDDAGRRAAAAGASGFMEAGVVYLRPDRYDPTTERGRYLLAHELAHVAQARLPPSADGPVGHDAAEAEAAHIGTAWARGESFAAPIVSLPAAAAADTGAEQMARARPVAQSDFVIHVGNDDFVVSFELLAAKAGAGGDVRVVISPRDFSRAYQSQMKYWDVRGREVDKDEDYVSMGNHSVPAAPWIQQIAIADRTKFNPVMKEFPEKGATAWTFDWNGDAKPEFGIRISFTISNTIRSYDFITSDNKNIKKFDFHFIQDDAWKHGYQGNISPRRQKDDFFDFLGDILSSKTTWEMAITMIPVVGEIVLLGEALTGYTIFGDKMSTTERVVAGLAAVLPVAAGVIAKGVTRGGADLAKVAAKVGRSEEEVMALLRAAEKQGVESAAVEKWSATLKAGGKLTADEVTKLQRMIRQLEADQRAFRAAAQRMANKGSRLTHTSREQALKELLEEAKRENILIHTDEEAQRLLDWAAKTEGADPATYHAVTIGEDIFVRPQHAENVRVLREEIIHVFQQRRGISSAEIVAGEIEARLMMIKHRLRWGITNDEVREMIQEVRKMRKTGKY